MEDMMAKLSSLLEQKETLTKYKDLLEMEREVTLKDNLPALWKVLELITTRLLMNTSHDSVPQ